jgi:hypothetical protein
MVPIVAEIFEGSVEQVSLSVGEIRVAIDSIRPGSEQRDAAQRGLGPSLRLPQNFVAASGERKRVVTEIRIDRYRQVAVGNPDHKTSSAQFSSTLLTLPVN